MSDTSDLPRETGSAKSGQTCPTCGADLPATTSGYGSVSAGPCPNCTGESLDRATAALDAETAERGYPLGDPSEDWDKGQLVAFATAKDVDLTGRKGSKAEIVAAINESGAVVQRD